MSNIPQHIRISTKSKVPNLSAANLDETNRTMSNEEWKIGDRCYINGKAGTIAFLGQTQFAHGEWVGINLDTDNGKNDGMVSGVRYFTCQPKHGLFCKIDKITRQAEDTDTYLQNIPSPSTVITSEHSMLDSRIQVGDRVVCTGDRTGIVRFVGTVHYEEGVWVGVELDTPTGKNDGMVKNTRYFCCKPMYGVMVPYKKVQLASNQTPNKFSIKHTKTSRLRLHGKGSHESLNSSMGSYASSVISSVRPIHRAKRDIYGKSISEEPDANVTIIREKDEHIQRLMTEQAENKEEIVKLTKINAQLTSQSSWSNDASSTDVKRLKDTIKQLMLEKDELEQKYHEEKKRAEDYMFCIDEMAVKSNNDVTTDDLNSEISSLHAQLDTAHNQHQEYKDEIEKLKLAHEDQISLLQQELSSLKVKHESLSQLEQTRGIDNEETSELKNQLEESQEKFTQIEKQLVESNNLLEQRAASIAQLSESLKRKIIDESVCIEKLNKATSRLEDAITEKETLQKEMDDFQSQIHNLKMENDVKTTRIEILERDFEATTNDLQQLKASEIVSTQSSTEQQKSIVLLTNELNDLRLTENRLKTELQLACEEVKTVTDQLSALKLDRNDLVKTQSDEKTELTRQLANISTQLQQSGTKVAELEVQLNNATNKLAEAEKSGADLQSQYSSSILASEKLSQEKSAIEAKLLEYVNHENLLTNQIASVEKTIVEKDEQLNKLNAEQIDSASLLQKQTEKLNEIKKQLDDCMIQKNNLKETNRITIAEAQKMITEKQSELKLKNEMAQSTEKMLKDEKEMCNQLSGKLNDLAAQLETSKDETQAARSESQARNEQLEDLRTYVEKLKQESQLQSGELEKRLSDEKEKLFVDLQAIKLSLNSTVFERDQLREQLSNSQMNATTEHEKLTQELDDRNKQLQHFKDVQMQLTQLQSKHSDALGHIAQLEECLKQLKDQNATHSVQSNQLSAALETAQEQIVESEKLQQKMVATEQALLLQSEEQSINLKMLQTKNENVERLLQESTKKYEDLMGKYEQAQNLIAQHEMNIGQLVATASSTQNVANKQMNEVQMELNKRLKEVTDLQCKLAEVITINEKLKSDCRKLEQTSQKDGDDQKMQIIQLMADKDKVEQEKLFELDKLTQQISDLTSQIDLSKKQADENVLASTSMKQVIETLKEEQKDIVAQLQEAHNMIAILDQEKVAAEKQILSLQNACDQVRTEHTHLQEKFALFDTQKHADEKARVDEQLLTLNNKITELTTANEALTIKLDQEMIEKQQLAEKASDLESTTVDSTEIASQMSELEKTVKDLSLKLEHESKQAMKYKTDSEMFQEQLNELKSNLSSSSSLVEENKRLAEENEKLKNVSSPLTLTDDIQLEKLRSENYMLKSEIEMLKNKHSSVFMSEKAESDWKEALINQINTLMQQLNGAGRPTDERYRILDDNLNQTQNLLLEKVTKIVNLNSELDELRAELKIVQYKHELTLKREADLKKSIELINETSPPQIPHEFDNHDNFAQQIDFLNNIIVEEKRKNYKLSKRMEKILAKHSKHDTGHAPSVKTKPKPRIYCDICGEFDLHETEDCPSQSSDLLVEPPKIISRTEKLAKKAPRKYCDNCEEFDHDTAECSKPSLDDSTY